MIEQEVGLGLEALLYPAYYQKFGVRRSSQLVNPTLRPLGTFEWPRASIMHHIPTDDVEYGPDVNETGIIKAQGLVYVDHITALTSTLGDPRTTMKQGVMLAKDFHRKFRVLRLVRKIDQAMRDQKNLIVISSSLLNHMWKYRITYQTQFFKWTNIQRTAWARANELARTSDRQQFYFFQLPDVIPALTELKRAEVALNKQTLQIFNTYPLLNYLDFWKWLGEERESSNLSLLEPETIQKMNFVFTCGGNYFVVNLGRVDDWRKETKEEAQIGIEALVASMESIGEDTDSAKLLQRKFLSATTLLFQTNSVAGDKVTRVNNPVTAADNPDAPETTADKAVAGVAVSRSEAPVAKRGINFGLKIQGLGVEPGTTGIVKTEKIGDTNEVEVSTVDDTFEDDDFEIKGGQALSDEVAHFSMLETDRNYESGVKAAADRLVDAGAITAAEYRRHLKLSDSFKRLKNPVGTGTLEDLLKIDPAVINGVEQMEIPDRETVFDKSMLKTTLKHMDKTYVNKVLHRDIANVVMSIQRGGISVTNYDVEKVVDAASKYEIHTVKLVPVAGQPSTFRFKLPIVEDDGTFTNAGVKMRMRKQRADLPIRKVGPAKVALTTYYSKLFIVRSEQKVHDYGRWLGNKITEMSFDTQAKLISSVHTGNCFYNKAKVPRTYSAMSQRFVQFMSKDIEWFWDWRKRTDHFGKDVVNHIEAGGFTICGRYLGGGQKDYIVCDETNTFYRTNGSKTTVLGDLADVLGIDSQKAPVETTLASILGKDIPVGFILGYLFGLENLLEMLKVPYRRVQRGSRQDLQPDEYVVSFGDESLIFSRQNRAAAMLLAGFNYYKSIINNYSVYDFNKPEVYVNVLEADGLGLRYIRELDLMVKLFIDHISYELLVDMKEPTTFTGLLLRANELLITDYHPDELDREFQRERGYERLSGAVYAEIVKSMRQYNSKPITSRAVLDISPHAVWGSIQSDPAVMNVEDINPIHNLKEQEAVTFSGTGGRSGRSMVRGTRVFHESDLGVISEATVDNASVAINTYTTANPNYVSLRGLSRRIDWDKDGPANLLSTSALVCPGSDRDDPKRVNFINIQMSHVVAADGYQLSPLATGYEQVIGSRTGDLFCTNAEQDGTVTAADDKMVEVTYKDGTKVCVELGKRYGVSAGSNYRHILVTDLKEGGKVKAGDTIAYNKGFFKPDPLFPKNTNWLSGVLARTVLMECPDTFEDGSAISRNFANKLNTPVTKVRVVFLDFKQTVHNMLKVGDHVDSDSMLCMIEDPVTSNNNMFDESSIATLRLLAAQTPRAKHTGDIEKIEVLYCGDTDDMSDTVRAIVQRADRERKSLVNKLGKSNTDAVTGEVDIGMRIDGMPLEQDKVAVKFYITKNTGAGAGDKVVFANQLKSVIGSVLTGVNKTEDGVDLDAVFGYKSIQARIVLSPEIMGITNTLLLELGKQTADLYFEGKLNEKK